jgi:hypothetical protein
MGLIELRKRTDTILVVFGSYESETDALEFASRLAFDVEKKYKQGWSIERVNREDVRQVRIWFHQDETIGNWMCRKWNAFLDKFRVRVSN